MRLKLAASFLCALSAVWMSRASLALSASSDSDRLAFLPLTLSTILTVLVVATAVTIGARRTAAAGVVWLSGLIALPWLPVEVPAAFLLWTGPMTVLPLAAMLLSAGKGMFVIRWQPRRDPLIAGAAAFLFFSACAWGASPSVPGGDEPHYLIITQSLLSDGDLRIENNHARGDYRAYFEGDLRPDFLKRGVDGEIYSIHAPGLPALIAPAFAVGGYRGVVLFLIALSALASALAWHVAWLATGQRGAAWFGWGAVTFATTTVFHTFSIYPDGVGGALVLTGVWALLRAEAERETPADGVQPWLLHGAALALLPWLHSRFAVLAGVLGVLILLRLARTRNAVRKGLAFLAVPIASGAGWFLFFYRIYGTYSPSAPYGGGELGSIEYVADGLAGLFFDQRFGLLTYAPVLVCAVAGLLLMLARRATSQSRRRLAIELLLVVTPYVLVVTYFRMWWAGWSAPARFATPIVFILAIPAAEAWAGIRMRGTRATAVAALCCSVLFTMLLAFVDGGRLAYNVRTADAQFFDWLSRNAELTAALPRWSDREAEFFRDILVWCLTMLAAWATLRFAATGTRLKQATNLATATAITYAIAAMIASTLSWQVKGEDGRNPLAAQMDLLAASTADRWGVALGLEPPRTMSTSAVARELRLRPKRLPADEDAPPGDRLLFAIPALPAGEYHLRPRAIRAEGELSISIGDGGPLQTVALTSTSQVIAVHIPVQVRALLVHGNVAAQRVVRGLDIEPRFVIRAGDRLTEEFAHDAVRYGDTTVYFLDDRSFPESGAFWVRGGRSSSIVLQPRGAPPRLFLRNAPVSNTITLESGTWREEFHLAAGEEREIVLPEPAGNTGMLIRLSTSSGFVPAEGDANSRDTRFLGVWVRLASPGADH